MDSDVLDRLAFLEKEVRILYRLIEFWNGKVPLKNRKAFPNEGEDPYFRAGPFKRTIPQVYHLGIRELKADELDLPIDPNEFVKAKKRMLQLLVDSKKKEKYAKKTKKKYNIPKRRILRE